MAYGTSNLFTGDKLMLYIKDGVNTLPVAFGTSCSIEITADTIDASSKMSGNWKEYLTGQLGYTVSCESLLSFTDGHMSFPALEKLMAERQPVSFILSQPKSGDAEFSNETDMLTGEAVITSLSCTANNGEICTCSLSMQGNGELVAVDNSEGDS